ncbi:MAG: hypothetical protein NZ958_06405 [Bacteroidia bacterium]|nr:hypothetical protein [Bacteroidia bacterium]MDW8088751.1 hypothetical protein [Bacteroidia bacterium]
MAEVLIVFIVIGLPIVGGLALAGYMEWLKYRRRSLPPSEKISQLEKQLHELRMENQQLRRRIQNLETIVASVEWDRVLKELSQPPTLEEGFKHLRGTSLQKEL